MTTRSSTLGVIVALALAGCACEPSARPDASFPDAGPTPCAPYAELEGAALRAALLACGVCVPAGHDVIGVLGEDFWIDNYAVPDGLVFRYGHRLVLVGPDHEQVWSEPFTDNADGLLPFGEIRMVPVTGQDLVWVLSAYRAPSFGEAAPGSVGLQAWSRADGWSEIGAARLDQLWPAVALDTGELIAAQYSRDTGYHLTRIAMHPDGDLDVVSRASSSLVGRWIERFGWSERDGTASVMLDGRGDWIPGSTPGPESTLLRLDSDLVDVLPPRRLSIALDDPLFDPRLQFPLPFVVVPRPEGGASIASSGRSTALGSAEYGLVWLQEVLPDGSLATAAPGYLVNGDDYPREDEVPIPGGSGASMTVGRLPEGRTVVLWDEQQMGLWPDGGRYLQVFERDGSPVLPEPRYLGPGFLVIEDPREPREVVVPSALDSLDHAYMTFQDLIRPGIDPPERVVQPRIERLDGEMQFVWPEGRRVDECGPGELNQGLIQLAGRADGPGVWVVWIEVQHDANGYRLPIVKVTLLDENGAYAW